MGRVIGRVSLGLSLWCASLAQAAIAPLDTAGLQSRAQTIVIARIETISVRSERSTIETGFGNFDWVVDLTLRVASVEKGDLKLTGTTISVRTFRVHSRKSIVEFQSSSGHRPIPARGMESRVYLQKRNGHWCVVLPNGFQPVVDGHRLKDAPEVLKLRSRFTYHLPLSTWMLLFLLSAIALAILQFLRSRRKTRERKESREE
ncbi:MAG: hypothetical protein AAF517_07175 [Planctomycetota bacterium]